ncbi:TPA: fimbrial protein [Serratia fonticola]
MMFKHTYLYVLFPVLAIFPGTRLMAADPAINLTGRVIAAACTVETGLASGKTVELGTVRRTALQHPGDAGAWNAFTLNLLNCPVGTTKTTVTFTGTPDGDDSTLFANTEPAPGAAQSVAVQMAQDSDRSRIISNSDTLTVNIDAGTHTASFPLAARLYASADNVQAGRVSSTVLVNFSYE